MHTILFAKCNAQISYWLLRQTLASWAECYTYFFRVNDRAAYDALQAEKWQKWGEVRLETADRKTKGRYSVFRRSIYKARVRSSLWYDFQLDEADGTLGCRPGHRGAGCVETMGWLSHPAPIHGLLRLDSGNGAPRHKPLPMPTVAQQQARAMVRTP